MPDLFVMNKQAANITSAEELQRKMLGKVIPKQIPDAGRMVMKAGRSSTRVPSTACRPQPQTWPPTSHRITGRLKAQLPANPKGRSKDLLWEHLNFLSVLRLKAGSSKKFSWLGCVTKPERLLGREKKVHVVQFRVT